MTYVFTGFNQVCIYRQYLDEGRFVLWDDHHSLQYGKHIANNVSNFCFLCENSLLPCLGCPNWVQVLLQCLRVDFVLLLENFILVSNQIFLSQLWLGSRNVWSVTMSVVGKFDMRHKLAYNYYRNMQKNIYHKRVKMVKIIKISSINNNNKYPLVWI